MKKLLLVMSVATVLVACNSNPNTAVAEQAKTIAADTAGLAAFNAAKQEQALAEQIAYAVAVAPKAAPQVRTVTKYVPVRSNAKSSSARRSTARAASSNKTVAAAPEVINSESSNTAKRSKISKAAKGAIIGGVAGAVTGAVVNKKNRVMGAVIGGVAGAAGGAVIGRGMDKKDGRYLTPGFNSATY